MGEHSIFGETGGTGRRVRAPKDRGGRRLGLLHGLFGTRLLPAESKSDDDDESELPASRN